MSVITSVIWHFSRLCVLLAAQMNVCISFFLTRSVSLMVQDNYLTAGNPNKSNALELRIVKLK